MSANGETSAVMKGIKHGACDYLLKPVRIEELKNIWQQLYPEVVHSGGIADPLRTFPFPIYKYYNTIYISDNDLAP